MKKGDILKGEIIIFEEKDGDITFKDLEGNTYSITRKEYKYFRENVRYYLSDKDSIKIIKERKINQFEITVGLQPASVLIENVNPDLPSFINTQKFSFKESFVPLNVTLGIGKYFERKHYIGAVVNIGLFYQDSDVSSYFSTGFKYKYQYDAYKGNTAFYLIGKGDYTFTKGAFRILSYNESNSNPRVGSDGLIYKLNYPELGIGHGMAFLFNNKKSIAIELTASRSLIINEKLTVKPDFFLDRTILEANRTISSIVLSIVFNL